jgi:hypothetical protein
MCVECSRRILTKLPSVVSRFLNFSYGIQKFRGTLDWFLKKPKQIEEFVQKGRDFKPLNPPPPLK